MRESELDFFEKFALFKGWSRTETELVYLNSTQVTLRRNHVLYKQGEQADHIYFLKEGEIEMVTNTSTAKDNSTGSKRAHTEGD